MTYKLIKSMFLHDVQFHNTIFPCLCIFSPFHSRMQSILTLKSQIYDDYFTDSSSIYPNISHENNLVDGSSGTIVTISTPNSKDGFDEV